ncbi:cache domain-containing protein, partial [bacterium]|nr:cache domain-containing protein [bacterium]
MIRLNFFYKSKIFYKSMLVVSAITLIYSMVMLFVVLPRVENSTKVLEEQKGKEILNKVLLITSNMQNDLNSFQQNALEYYKNKLKSITEVFWSIVQKKYEQSNPDNIGTILEQRGKELEKYLFTFYNMNKDSMDEKELKEAIINYVKIYRYDNGTGYFFIHKGNKVIEHPINPSFKGKDFTNLTDRNGFYFVREFSRI